MLAQRATSDEVAVLDAEGTIIDVNQAWDRFAAENDGCSHEKALVGVNYLDVCRLARSPDDHTAAECLDGLRSVLNNACREFSFVYACHSEDEQRWFYMRALPLQGMTGAVVIHTDITKQKLAEIKLHEAERLHSEAEKLAGAGRLAARIAHEINNPLAGIKNAFRLIRGAVPENHPDHDMVAIIDEELDRIAGIVRQMYQLHSPNAQSLRAVVVEEEIRRVVALLEPVTQQHKVTIRLSGVEPEAVVSAPESSLRQIFFNLMGNAVEASPPGGAVEVRGYSEENGNGIVVEFRDRGCGIAEDVRDRIFEPFFTTKDDAAHETGMGLGLSIVRNLVESIGGTIDFESELQRGTVFRVRLPCSMEIMEP